MVVGFWWWRVEVVNGGLGYLAYLELASQQSFVREQRQANLRVKLGALWSFHWWSLPLLYSPATLSQSAFRSGSL